MKKIILFILLFMPVVLSAQDIGDKDLSDMSFKEISKLLDNELKMLKANEGKGDKLATAHSLGNVGGIYLQFGRKLSDMEKKLSDPKMIEKIGNDKQKNLDKSISYSNKAISVSEDIGDIDQLKASYKNLSAAQKLSGNVKDAMASYAKMMTLKKTVLTAKKTNEVEKQQIESMRNKREDSILKANEAHLKEKESILAMRQKQLDSANKTLKVSELEKKSVSLALQRTQTDLSVEKRRAMEKEEKLTLAEQEQALQATNLQLQASQMALQENDLKLQRSKLDLQQSQLQLAQTDLQVKEKALGQQRLYTYIGLAGILIMAVFSFFIIRERKKAIQQKLRAERSEKFKQEFIANISHEIRTPMNAINGMTGLLLHKAPRPEQETYLQAISKSSDILLHVINDVLDLSKIEAGKLELETIDFSLSDTIQQVKDTLSYRAEDKGLQLITRIDDNVSDVVIGDPYRLNQVLINLGGNALKFTEKGGVHIDLDLVKKDSDNIAIKFSISDTGIGIPASKIATLFDSFTQVSSSDTRKYGGTGLGLSISKYLVELQGGKIAVESTVGSGTTFSFIINYPIGSESRLQQRMASERNVDGSILNGLRVLIADDNEYNRMVVDETLHLLADLHTELVVNGQEAVDMMTKNDYHLILMDVQMPVMNGMDATRHIRANLGASKKNIPIIALTASVLRSDLDLCYESGMTAYVPKPFKTWQLVNTIAEVTGRERSTDHTARKEPPKNAGNKNGSKNDTKNKPEVKPEAKSKPEVNGQPETVVQAEAPKVSAPAEEYVARDTVTDLDYLRNFCEGDEKRMKKYIKVYLNAIPTFTEKIDAAIKTKDFTEIALHVHSFKPKWMMMGMKPTNEMGIKIDHMCKDKNDKVFDHVGLLMAEVNKSVIELQDKV